MPTDPPPPAGPDAVLVDLTCSNPVDTTAGAFDLQSVRIERRRGADVFSARYAGDASKHDVHITFDLVGTNMRVDTELFEDGTGVAQLFDLATPESTRLEPPQTVAKNQVSVTIGADRIPGFGGPGSAANVVMQVDGLTVERCP